MVASVNAGDGLTALSLAYEWFAEDVPNKTWIRAVEKSQTLESRSATHIGFVQAGGEAQSFAVGLNRRLKADSDTSVSRSEGKRSSPSFMCS
ncbi:hypothetical protein GCM10009825_34840 [Arthrobacter humicola]|uniref:Uncharacterized protein n=1 Tax=Arthrobacter humicola TaxID=409291 RepID=A0ABP5LEK3_9MICC